MAKNNSLMFIRDFIAEGKDQNIPLSETYLLYGEYVKEKFPRDPVLSPQAYSRITSDYFYKKSGTKNNKAISLDQLEKDLKRKMQNIHNVLITVERVKKNRQDLLTSFKFEPPTDSSEKSIDEELEEILSRY